MEKKNYKPRLIDNLVEEYLKTFGALCIEGPKWCGKTWTSSFHCTARYDWKPRRKFSKSTVGQK